MEPYKNEIIAAVKMHETKIYFFFRYRLYLVFNSHDHNTETTYAQAITEKTLPGLRPYVAKIRTAVACIIPRIYAVNNVCIYLGDSAYPSLFVILRVRSIRIILKFLNKNKIRTHINTIKVASKHLIAMFAIDYSTISLFLYLKI
ncbi:hypothetical protein [Sphingobacterium kitahiroshimense]|uniref:DDE Tnp4 domain-containing protein n=1 Tax=Sphingobacterium kitahiroshimense TaxID=470446 RepID=A0ABV0BPM3_9SPHI